MRTRKVTQMVSRYRVLIPVVTLKDMQVCKTLWVGDIALIFSFGIISVPMVNSLQLAYWLTPSGWWLNIPWIHIVMKDIQRCLPCKYIFTTNLIWLLCSWISVLIPLEVVKVHKLNFPLTNCFTVYLQANNVTWQINFREATRSTYLLWSGSHDRREPCQTHDLTRGILRKPLLDLYKMRMYWCSN